MINRFTLQCLVLLICFGCGIGISRGSDGETIHAPAQDVAAATQTYQKFLKSIREGKRDQAVELAWVPKDYLSSLVATSIDALVVGNLLRDTAERTLGRNADFDSMWALVPREGEYVVRAADEHGALYMVASKEFERMAEGDPGAMLLPIGWIIQTEEGVRVNVLVEHQRNLPFVEWADHPDEETRAKYAQQEVMMKKAIPIVKAMIQRLDAREFEGYEEFGHAYSEALNKAFSQSP